MKPIIAAVAAIALLVIPAAAQQDTAAQSRARVLGEAARLGNAGDIFAARRLTDSLGAATASDASDFADVLFARATFAPSVLDASLDYEKIVTAAPRSSAARSSLLRLAQRAMISSESAKALDYLQQIIRDYPDDASVAEAQYWRTRILFDAHDITAACSANREALAHARAARSPLAAAIESQGAASCGNAAVATIVAQPRAVAPRDIAPTDVVMPSAPVKASASPRKEYAVQVAAFTTRRDADALANRLKQRGLDAHVDGSTNPFRVRIGHYATYADAAKAQRELSARKIAGFVSEGNQ